MLVLVGVLQIVRTLLNTLRIITIQNNEKILSTLLLVFVDIISLTSMAFVVIDLTLAKVIVVVGGSALGSHIALYVSDRISKDRVYIHHFILFNKNKEYISYIIDNIKEIKEDLVVVIQEEFTLEMTKILSILVYTETREQSIKLDNFMSKEEEIKKLGIIKT